MRVNRSKKYFKVLEMGHRQRSNMCIIKVSKEKKTLKQLTFKIIIQDSF